MRNIVTALFLGVSFLNPISASALTAHQTVNKVVEVKNEDGSTAISYEPANLVAPGEKVAYSLNIENDGGEPATDLVLTMPVPTEVKFVEGTAQKLGTTVSYSTDGGETYSDRIALRVITADGRSRAAQSEDITHIRWKLSGPIDVGGSDILSFQGILK